MIWFLCSISTFLPIPCTHLLNYKIYCVSPLFFPVDHPLGFTLESNYLTANVISSLTDQLRAIHKPAMGHSILYRVQCCLPASTWIIGLWCGSTAVTLGFLLAVLLVDLIIYWLSWFFLFIPFFSNISLASLEEKFGKLTFYFALGLMIFLGMEFRVIDNIPLEFWKHYSIGFWPLLLLMKEVWCFLNSCSFIDMCVCVCVCVCVCLFF